VYQIDNVGNPSWQAQVSGTKLWTLVPPPECYFECAEKLEATVSPGEISMSSYFNSLKQILPTLDFFCLLDCLHDNAPDLSYSPVYF